MFYRVVSVDGTEVAIPCSRNTPYSDVLRRAADIVASEEAENHRLSLVSRISSATSDRRALA